MKRVFSTLLLSCFGLYGFTQDFTVETVTPLDGTVFESSGLIKIEDRIITHNDSGGGHYLYEVSPIDGEVIRTVVVANAGNVDWEDLCYDDEYIYIGDFGNNAGSRTNLRIYRVSITDYLTSPDDTVYCDTITFSYSDQVDFEPAAYTTNFDAEAFIAYNDSLYLFTKNWGNYETNIYAIPKEIGDYSINIVDQINTEGLITGASYDPLKNEILLIGYTLTAPLLYFIKGFEGNAFSDGNLARSAPGFEGSIQIEGVCALGDHSYYVSSENEGGTDSFLHLIKVSNFIGLDETITNQIKVYPNPTQDHITIEGIAFDKAQLIDAKGNVVINTSSNQISLQSLSKGVYQLIVIDSSDQPIGKTIIVKE